MPKNKGGREVRKPKQPKKPKIVANAGPLTSKSATTVNKAK